LWSVAQRMVDRPNRAAMVKAFDDGQLLRTHVLRPTWHFAAPQDIRWMLRLTAPKLGRMMGSYFRQNGLDAAVISKSQRVLSAAVEGGHHCARKELANALESAGIATGGIRLGFLLMIAEYDEVLISGAMQGKQQTYAAFDERVPAGPDYDEDQALAEMARRYVITRAPVTAKDLAGWASLTLTQARRGLAAIESECRVDELDGMTVWSAGEQTEFPPSVEITYPVVDLVQPYDEVIMSYFESRRLLAPAGILPVPDRAIYGPAVLIDGQLAGHWRHQLGRSDAVIEIQLRRRLSGSEQGALRAAVAQYGAYLGMPTTLAAPELLA
ncbi:MAG: winged helix DNA-binding domain-containing protein, partial [Nakamurella sp.]